MDVKINRKRSIQKIIRLDETENEFVKNKVKKSPYDNFQNYARHLLLTGEIHYFDYSLLQQLNFEVRKIGININQLVKLAHLYGEVSQEDIEDVIELQKQLEKIVNEKLKTEIRREEIR